MRTMSLVGFVAALVLIGAMIGRSEQYMWTVFATHVVCLVAVSRTDAARRFVEDYPVRAQTLEVVMYTLALATFIAFKTEYILLPIATAMLYAGTWYALLQHAPPFPNDPSLSHALPLHWREVLEEDDRV